MPLRQMMLMMLPLPCPLTKQLNNPYQGIEVLALNPPYISLSEVLS